MYSVFYRGATMGALYLVAATGCGAFLSVNGKTYGTGSAATTEPAAASREGAKNVASETKLASSSGATSTPASRKEAPTAPSKPKVESMRLADIVGDRVKPELIERPNDIIALFESLDPKLLVHTTSAVEEYGMYCSNVPDVSDRQPWCTRFEQGENTLAEASELRQFNLPKQQKVLSWFPDQGYAGIGSSPLKASLKRILPNTPGFILSPIPYRYGEVRFLALDGGFYILKEKALAVGAPPASAWPETVQHSDYALEVLSRKRKLENGTELSRSVSPALTKVFDGKLETFRKCVYDVFRSGDRAFAANNAANITEQTRRNRAQQLDDMIVARAEKECRAAFVAFGNAYGKVLDERRADRERIYAAAKKRFQR